MHGDSLHLEESRFFFKKYLILWIVFICLEGFILKPALLIKKTAVQNVRDLEKDTKDIWKSVKWKFKVTRTIKLE